MDWIDLLLIPSIKVAVLAGVMILSVPAMVLAERKIIGRIQQRPGPNRVGLGKWHLWGISQTVVDGIKLMLKEDYIPPKAEKLAFILAPILVLIPAMLTFMIIPLGPPIEITIGETTRMVAAGATDLPVGILFYMAMTSVGVYGIVLAGWSSNSKYSLLGGIRSSAQLLSYELTLGLSLIGVFLITGTVGLKGIIESQTEYGLLSWHVFRQPVGFLLFLVSGFAETNRLPFDLPEGESELGAGFHTEYSSIKWAIFMMGEYINILTFGAIMTTLFLGGYHGPIPIEGLSPILAVISGIFWFSLKVSLIFFFFVWVRGTLPRLRYDQLMDLGWKGLFPLGVANILVTAGIIVSGLPMEGIWFFIAGCGLLWGADRISEILKRRALSHAA